MTQAIFCVGALAARIKTMRGLSKVAPYTCIRSARNYLTLASPNVLTLVMVSSYVLEQARAHMACCCLVTFGAPLKYR